MMAISLNSIVLSSILQRLKDGPRGGALHIPAKTSISSHEIKNEKITPGGLRSGGEGLAGVAGPEISRQSRAELPRIVIGIVYFNSQPVLDVDEAADEPDTTNNDEFEAVASGGTVVEDTQKRVDPGEVQRRGETPGGFEERGEAEFGSGGEQEATGAEKRGGRGVVVVDKVRETKPRIGQRIEGKRLVLLRRNVVETEEEEPRVGKGSRGGESRGGNEGIPEFANRGSTEEGRDWEGREDEFGQIGAKGVDVSLFRVGVRHCNLQCKPRFGERNQGMERQLENGEVVGRSERECK
ncbi:cation channel sperm-associated protein subunit gamma, partial [Corchorus capsularis]